MDGESGVGIAEIDADWRRFMLPVKEPYDAISQRWHLSQIKQCMQFINCDAAALFGHEQ
ncbi:MAG: hypothetical protein WA632_01060 [Gallionella sp.]